MLILQRFNGFIPKIQRYYNQATTHHNLTKTQTFLRPTNFTPHNGEIRPPPGSKQILLLPPPKPTLITTSSRRLFTCWPRRSWWGGCFLVMQTEGWWMWCCCCCCCGQQGAEIVANTLASSVGGKYFTHCFFAMLCLEWAQQATKLCTVSLKWVDECCKIKQLNPSRFF